MTELSAPTTDTKMIDSDSKTSTPIAIVLINYNGYQDTLECIESIKNADLSNIHAKVFVVDNASPDRSGTQLREDFEDSEFVAVACLDRNIGFSGANNYAAKLALAMGFEYLMFLNNDTIVDPSFFQELLPYAGEDVVLSPMMLYHSDPDRIWFAGGSFDPLGMPRHMHIGESAKETRLEPSEMEYATGCSILMSRKAFEDTGGFDEDLFLYWEDADLSIRLSRGGFKLYFVPSATLWHKVSASTGGSTSPVAYYYLTRNRLYVIKKLNLGIRPLAWSYLGLILGLLSPNEEHSLAARAFSDYKNGKLGKLEE